MRTHVAALLALGALTTSGCEGKLSEIIPKDMSATAGDGGGTMVDLGPKHFTTDVQPSLNKLSCASAVGCHLAPNGNDPKFVPNATADADVMANYVAFMAECTPLTTGDNSTAPILLNPLDDGTDSVSHSGGMLFASKADPNYVLWLSWINDGQMY